MHRKFIKQLIYGSFYAAIIGLVIWGIYAAAFAPAPSCFDEKKNQNEEDVDCGGECADCALRTVQAIQVPSKLLVNSPVRGRSTLLLQFENPNANYGANPFTYTVNLFGADGQIAYTVTDKTFIYPSELKYQMEINIPVIQNQIARIEASVSDIHWVRQSEFPLPATQVRDIEGVPSARPDELLVRGVLKNENPYTLSKVTLNTIVYDVRGVLAGISKTFLENILSEEEREFQIIVPLFGADASSVTLPRIVVEPLR